MNIMDKSRADFVNGIIKNKDKIIHEAISRCIGDIWSFDEIKGRCHTSNVPGTTLEVFYIDSRPIVQFDEPTFNVSNDGLSTSITSELKYRFIGNDCRENL